MTYAGMLRVKNVERWVEEVLFSLKGVVSQVFLFDDHSSDRTLEIVESFGSFVRVIPSPYPENELNEARDKDWLLSILMLEAPDWVVAIDGDEVLEKQGGEKIRAIATREEVAVMRFKVEYLWDAPDRVRVDGIYGRFYRPSAFRLRGQDFEELTYRTTGAGQGANLHCSNYPLGIRGAEVITNIRLKHYGYLDAADRIVKYLYYNRVDPGNQAEDEYRHIMGISGARHAPGPVEFTSWLD